MKYWLILLTLCAATTATAQERTVSARVTEIAGANLYLDAGSNVGLANGDTLIVRRAADVTPVGTFVVVAVTETRAVVAFAGTRGGLACCDPATIAAFVATLAGYQAKTVEQKLCAVRAFLRFASDAGLADARCLPAVPLAAPATPARIAPAPAPAAALAPARPPPPSPPPPMKSMTPLTPGGFCVGMSWSMA